MRKLPVLVAALCGVVLLAQPAGAQTYSRSVTEGWGGVFNTPTPELLPGGPAPGQVKQLETTNTTTYVLDKAGQVWAAGDNTEGELGDGTTSSQVQDTFVRVDIPNPVRTLALVGPNGTMTAIDDRGNVWGWGFNNWGQLCESPEDVSTPVNLTALGLVPAGVTMIAGAGSHNTFYVKSTRTFWSCGDHFGAGTARAATDYGELGDGTDVPPTTYSPVRVLPIPDRSAVVSMTASWRDEGVLFADGKYFAWGFNEYGQLGYNGPSTNTTEDPAGTPDPEYDSYRPEQVPLPYRVRVVPGEQTVTMGGGLASNGQTMAVLADGKYYGWGDDQDGQLCDGNSAASEGVTSLYYPSPTLISTPEPIREVASGGITGYLLAASGDLYSCGDNSTDQLGNGTTVTPSPPVLQKIFTGGVSQVSSTARNAAVEYDPDGK